MLQIVVRNKIVQHVYLRVVGCKWWNHELWLVEANDILRLSSRTWMSMVVAMCSRLENFGSLTSACLHLFDLAYKMSILLAHPICS